MAALISVLAVLAAGCGRAVPQTTSKRIVVLGIDAMDPNFVERHWDSLPNLDRLRHEGDFRRLGTTIPPQSPVAWSTFATGLNPGGHGIYDFVYRHPETMVPFSSMAETEPPRWTLSLGPYIIPLSSGEIRRYRKGRTFWQTLGDHGVPTTMLRMPNDFPPVECAGQTLAGMGTPDLRGTFGTFTFFTDDPQAEEHDVPGGRIVPVVVDDDQVSLVVQGPDNTLRKDHAPSDVTITVHRDPERPVALFEVQDTKLILKEGEWSGWIRVRFPALPVVKSAAGMFRLYAKKLNPEFQVYVSPVNIDPFEPELPISQPASYSRHLAEEVGPYYTQGIAEDTAAFRSGVLTRQEYRAQTAEVAREHFRVLERALDEMKGGVLFFHFLGVDQDSHMLWGEYEDELLQTYERVDREIGRVMKKIGDATLIVISDHGFNRFDRAVHLNTWLWKQGYLTLDDPSAAGEDEMFAHVDWSRTRAYALGLNGLYLNLKGRERDGIVEPGPQADRLVDEIAARLEEFRDPANGKRVVEKAYKAREVYHGAAMASAPDIVVGWEAGYRGSWQTALGAVPPVLIEDNKDEWRGDHCIAADLVPGVFISNRKCHLSDPNLADVPVTLLGEFGVPPGPGMEGRRIF